MSDLTTASEVIDALGGTAATARLTKRPLQSVSNWRAADKLPSELFLIMSDALERIDCEAPPKLWGIAEPSRAAS